MTELLEYVTSDFFVFLGCLIFTTGVIISIGWAANAMLLGIKGVKCDNINIL